MSGLTLSLIKYCLCLWNLDPQCFLLGIGNREQGAGKEKWKHPPDMSVLRDTKGNYFSRWLFFSLLCVITARDTDLINQPCKCNDCEPDRCEANKCFTVNCQGIPATCSGFAQIDCLLSSCLMKSLCYVWTFNQNVTKSCILGCFIWNTFNAFIY